MRRLVLVLVVLLVLAGGSGAWLVTRAEERRRVRVALRDAAERAGLEADFLDAIGMVESRWRLAAVNQSGPDGARGGAWGPTQITERTARGHGYTGPMEAFTRDPELAALWTARILRASANRRPLLTLADYVAAWNAGKDDADRNDDGQLEELREDHPTRVDYLPKAVVALTYVRENAA